MNVSSRNGSVTKAVARHRNFPIEGLETVADRAISNGAMLDRFVEFVHLRMHVDNPACEQDGPSRNLPSVVSSYKVRSLAD